MSLWSRLRETAQAVRTYPEVCVRLEVLRQEAEQTQKALEKSEQECERLTGDNYEAGHRLKFSEKKSEALQAALAAFCPKLDSLASMTQFYETISPGLDPRGFTLYRTAKRMTGIDLHTVFPYEDNHGKFGAMDGHELLCWLTAVRFNAVNWELIAGRGHDSSLLREVDTSAPEYQAFEQKLYRAVLSRMGFGEILAPEELMKFEGKEVIVTEEKTTELKLYSPLAAELYEPEPEDEDTYGPQVLGGGELVSFQAAIRQGIEDERMPEDAERGLMTYFDGQEAVNEKVVSVFPDVEEIDGKLYGVAVCQIKGILGKKELEELKEFCVEQYADGWGEGYAQRPRETNYGKLYVSFWQYDGFSIRTKEELEAAKAPARSRPQRKGGER